MLSSILFYFLMGCVAFLYAAIGHGGATGYIAIMSLFGFLPEKIRPIALSLNIIAAGISFFLYQTVVRARYDLTLALLVGSIPMAFIGGQYTIAAPIYKYILAIILCIPAYRFLFNLTNENKEIRNPNLIMALLVGMILGLISGMIGIGGGVLLAPLLILFGWTTTKQASFISALFIVLNSLAGLMGYLSKNHLMPDLDYILFLVIIIGASFGAYIGSQRMSANWIKKTLALVLIIAIFKLIFVS